MTALDPSELQASSLSDLHAIADQFGLDGYRRLRKAELIDAIITASGGTPPAPAPATEPDAPAQSPRRRPPRSRRPKSPAQEETDTAPPTKDNGGPERTADGVVELLGNGSAFLRIDPPEPSDEDVYISAAQVRRCELVSGDKVGGPVRTPRRSERYPSLVRIDTINGSPADTVAGAPRFEDLAVSYPTEHLELGSQDPTLKAIEWLTPIGRGSRAVILGASRSGKTHTLRLMLAALAQIEGLEIMAVLAGSRPEEISEFREGPVTPVAALSFAASADSQDQAVERAIDTAKRVASRGGHVVVLIDTLDGLHPHSARKALAAARKLTDGGSLTVIATASRAFGGESTLIALDVALTSVGRLPALDLMASGTLRAELLVGEDGAQAITQARAAAAIENAG